LLVRFPTGVDSIWICPSNVKSLTCNPRSLHLIRSFDDQPPIPKSVVSFCYRDATKCSALSRALRDNQVWLEELTIHSSTISGEDWALLLANQPTLQKLTYISANVPLRPLISHPWILPKLRNIKFISCQELEGDEIIELLRVRRPQGVEDASLKECIVEGCDLVTDRHHHVIDTFFDDE